jgi:hypothetical protein
LGQLFTCFLERRAAEQQTGLSIALEDGGEVIPFQAAAAPTVDPRTALQAAMEAANHLLSQTERVALQPTTLPDVPEWSMLVRSQEAGLAVPFCLGNFPQMLKTVLPLLEGTPLSGLTTPIEQTVPAAGLSEWCRQMLAQTRLTEALFGAAALRLANQFEAADQQLDRVRALAPASWAGLLDNEAAALAWHRGHRTRAAKLWSNHPDQDCPVILFNRGMAALFADQPAAAAPLLARAAAALPESDPWHHLAQLYLTLTGEA